MARMRSPNFPGLSLEDAVKFVKIIWEKNRRAPISREAGAKDLGYTGLTGRSLQVFGALNQYDLIENVSKGQMRVTKTAEDILIGFPEEIRRAAVTQAGHSPTLFRDIYERFEGVIPGENAVRFFLLQRGFTNEGVNKALRSFEETNRYVEMFGDSESYRETEDALAESAPTAKEEPKVEVAVAQSEPRPGGFFESGPLDFVLSTSGLKLTGKTNSASELKAFIEKLKALTVLLGEPKEENGQVE